MGNKSVFALAILAVVFAYAGTQVALAPESNTLPILPTPDFSKLTAYPVVRVVDGDTIVVERHGEQVKVRLIGVDTPETVHPSKPIEHYGKEAPRFTTNLLKGESVYLLSERSHEKTDRYGRTLAYVYRAPDGLFVNAEIIRQGYGHAYTRFPFKYMKQFRQLEQFAGNAGKGLWASAPTELPSSTSARSLKTDKTSMLKHVVLNENVHHLPATKSFGPVSSDARFLKKAS
jgi:endonuclease YncB( thermonuclease family)